MQVYHHNCFAMGTRFNAVFPGISNALGQKLGEGINAILQKEEQRLSCFRFDSDISVLNNDAVVTPVIVSDEMVEVLNSCQYFYHKTGGAFDPGLLNFSRALNRNNEVNNPQSQEDNVGGGWGDVSWNPVKRELFITNPRTGIDLGGFGKGWAIEKISKELKSNGVNRAFISFGESSVTAIGSHPFANHWSLTIKHPETGVATILDLTDVSVSVSGLQFKGTEFKPHIIKPSTKTMVNEHRLVVVKSVSPLESEVLSTAVLAANPTQLESITENFKSVTIYECITGASVFKCLTKHE